MCLPPFVPNINIKTESEYIKRFRYNSHPKSKIRWVLRAEIFELMLCQQISSRNMKFSKPNFCSMPTEKSPPNFPCDHFTIQIIHIPNCKYLDLNTLETPRVCISYHSWIILLIRIYGPMIKKMFLLILRLKFAQKY